jgi:hypothetical protein
MCHFFTTDLASCARFVFRKSPCAFKTNKKKKGSLVRPLWLSWQDVRPTTVNREALRSAVAHGSRMRGCCAAGGRALRKDPGGASGPVDWVVDCSGCWFRDARQDPNENYGRAGRPVIGSANLLFVDCTPSTRCAARGFNLREGGGADRINSLPPGDSHRDEAAAA